MDEPESNRKEILDLFRRPILDAFAREGISDAYLAKLLRKELEAKHIKPFLGPGGEVVYSKELDALEIQQRARQDAHKLRGDYPAEKHQIDGDVIVEIVNYAASKIDKDVDK